MLTEIFIIRRSVTSVSFSVHVEFEIVGLVTRLHLQINSKRCIKAQQETNCYNLLCATCLSSLSLLQLQDFLIMFIHHLATIGLISFSYVNNMVRVGSLVMCVHDASDFLLEVS